MSTEELDNTQYYQSLVTHAIGALGFSREERDLKIQQTSTMNINAKAINSAMLPNVHEVIFTGSFADGLNFDTSDLDVIRRHPGYKVLSKFILPSYGPLLSYGKQGWYAICGIEYEEEFPCYVKLPIIETHFSSNLTNLKCLNTYYLKNTVFLQEMYNSKKLSDISASAVHMHKDVQTFKYRTNGPAVREEFYDTDTQRMSKRDLVLTLFMDDWPCIGREFLTRKRLNNWPSRKILKSMQTKGCDLAPVGHSESREKELLWRISFCGEKDLFTSLNEIQVYCFLLMKIILKDDMPLNDIISSFHLKNVIYWCIERSPASWSSENLFFAFKRCIFRLMDFLCNGYLPYYIVPNRNLFNAQLTEEIAENLIQVWKKYADNPVNVLTLASFNELYLKTISKMKLSERITNLNLNQLELKTQRSIIRQCFTVKRHILISIENHEYWKYLTPWHDVRGGINNWKRIYRIMLSGYKPYMDYVLKYIKCMGALMIFASYKQNNNVRDLSVSRCLIKESLDLRVSSATLRAASFFYIEKEYDKCTEICETFLKRLPRFESDRWMTTHRYIELETDLSELKKWKDQLLLAYGKEKETIIETNCHLVELYYDFPYVSFKEKYITVVYVTAEKWTVPEVLLYELLSRSEHSDNDYYKQFAGIFVDPVFNARLLLYLCDRDMTHEYDCNNHILENHSLESMQQILQEGRLEPVYQYCNIYSYCLLKSNLKVKAVKYLLESVDEYPSKYNVAYSYLKIIIHVLLEIAVEKKFCLYPCDDLL